jgi:hypothetical protein
MFSTELAQSIREQGFDVAEARQLPGKIQEDDYALLERAAEERRAYITCNYRDRRSNFCVIHEEWLQVGKEHFGIILIPQFRLDSHYQRWAIRHRVLNFFNSHTWDELQNQLMWLP